MKESRDPDILNASRRRRIAAGSGIEVQDMNRLIKQFSEAQKVMKMFQRLGERDWGSCLGSMKLKVSFLNIFLFLITVFSNGCQVPPNQPLKELAESIMIHDEWCELSPVAPIIVKYTLVKDEENSSGQVYYSVISQTHIVIVNL